LAPTEPGRASRTKSRLHHDRGSVNTRQATLSCEYSGRPATLELSVTTVARDFVTVCVRSAIQIPVPGAVAIEFYATSEAIREFLEQALAVADSRLDEAWLADSEGAIVLRMWGIRGTREWLAIEAGCTWPVFPPSCGGALAEPFGSGFRVSCTDLLATRDAVTRFAQKLRNMMTVLGDTWPTT